MLNGRPASSVNAHIPKSRVKACGWVFALARTTTAFAFGPFWSKQLHRPIHSSACHRVRLSQLSQPQDWGYIIKRSHWNSRSGQSVRFSSSSSKERSEKEEKMTSSKERTEKEKIMTDDALAIVQEAIRAVDPYTAVRKHLVFSPETNQLSAGNSKKYSMNDIEKVVIIAFGKASTAMAAAVIEQLTNENDKVPSIQGVVTAKDDHGTEKERRLLESYGILFREASHPVPDERSASAAQEIMDLVSRTASARTLVICCISGGGSALFCLPQDRLSLDELRQTNSVLLESGLSIQEINVIRKRLEDGKGGRLAAAAYPSTILSLVLSDVLGDPLDLIASGPTVPDTSTFEDAWRLVEQNGLLGKLPKNVVQLLQDGSNGKVPDSPSEEDPIFQENKCETIIVGNNELAVEAAAAEAHRRGYDAKILGTRIEGEAKHVANVYASMAQHLALQRDSTPQQYTLAELPAALIGGGETTVSIPVDSTGKGGRNQELGLAAALKFQELGLRDVVLASVGTDGTDGPTDAAGAVVDGGLVQRLDGTSAEDFLRRHDAYNFLNQKDTDGHTPLIKTGPTGTNVADVCVTLIR